MFEIKNKEKRKLSLSGASSEPIISAESKRNQAMSLRGRAVGSDVVIFHAETEKALSLSGESSEPIISAESLYCHARPRSGISAESKRDTRLIATQSPRMTGKAMSFLRLRGASGAQGNSTPASCRKAHKRRFILNQWLLRFANASLRITIPTLAFIFTLATTSESSAGTWDCGEIANTVSCTLDENGVFTISGTGKMKDYSETYDYGWKSTSPWRSIANIQTVVVGTGVTSIGSGAFQNVSSLTSITIPDSVTSIGDRAFKNADSLTNITIPKGVTSIGNNAFDSASSLTSITIPDSVTSIGDRAFWGVYNLTSITIPEGVTSIGTSAFYDTFSLKSITIPDSLTSIGSWAFGYADDLTSITIPDSVTSIGDKAFYGASRLTNIMCKGDAASCADTVNALRAKGYTGKISYPTNKTSCEGSGISLYVWDGSKCSRRNEEQCNSVAKYYYSDGQCQVLPKTQSACTGTNIEWNVTDNKCVYKNNTPPQEDNNGNTGGDVSGDFNPADCYNNGQVPYNNQCWDEYPFAKKRWTPAEANEWLHDGNDNFVVITFKK